MEKYRLGIVITATIVICITVIVWAQGPIPQPIEYHNFEDSRTFLSIPNFFNVMSNLPFIIVGFMGLYSLLFTNKIIKIETFNAAYFFLFLGVFLVGFGSGYYHLMPNNQSLVWDRLPMTIAFMSLISIIIAEYVSIKLGKSVLYPLLFIGIASVLYWYITELRGVGDLRLYGLVQFIPIIIIPLILYFMKPMFTLGKSYWWLILTYVLAKLFEHFDVIMAEMFFSISGHTIKHVIAALGMWILLQGYKKRVLAEPNDNL